MSEAWTYMIHFDQEIKDIQHYGFYSVGEQELLCARELESGNKKIIQTGRCLS